LQGQVLQQLCLYLAAFAHSAHLINKIYT